MKVNLEHIKELDREAKRLMSEYFRIRGEIACEGWFCDKCGEKNPEGGFYPLGIHGPDSISGIVCNSCRRK